MDTLMQDDSYLEIALENLPKLLMKARDFQKVLDKAKDDKKLGIEESDEEKSKKFVRQLLNIQRSENVAIAEILDNKKNRIIIDQIIKGQDYRDEKIQDLDHVTNRGINKMQCSDNNLINKIGRIFAAVKAEFY